MSNFNDMNNRSAIRTVLTIIFSLALTLGYTQEVKKRRGRVKIKHPNGQVMAKGRVRNHHKQGLWKYWDDQGRIHSSMTFRNDTAHGEYVSYSQDGSISEKGNYSCGKKSGAWQIFSGTGMLVSEMNFVNGELYGEQKSWYENGQMREYLVIYFTVMKERRAWYSNGRIKLTEYYVDGKPNGVWLTYPEPVTPADTFPATLDEYSFGKREGRHQAFFGTVKIEEYHYSNDKLDGASTKWDKTGLIEKYEVYSAGRLSGTCEYYRNGLLIRKVNYKNNIKDGTETDYSRDGEKLRTSWYTMGKLDSVFAFHPNGKTASVRRYNRALPGQIESSTYVEWDTAGVKLLEGNFVGERKSGKWTTFYPGGKVRSVTNYVNGQINGLYTKWYPNGRKMLEMHVFENGINTNPDVWDEKGRVIKMGSTRYNEIIDGNKPGEVFNDPLQYNRAVIDRRVEEVQVMDDYLIVEEVDLEMPDLNLIETDGIEDYDKLIPSSEDTNQVYSFVDQEPLFPGGAVAMMKFISDSLRYPPTAKEAQIQGRVYLGVVIEKDGSVGPITVLRGIPGANELEMEAIRVVRLFPKFSPALINGRPVRYRYIIPIRFQLQ